MPSSRAAPRFPVGGLVLALGLHFFVTLLPLLLQSPMRVDAYTVRVPPFEQVCFYEDLVPNQKVQLSFQVGEGISREIDYWLADPSHAILYIATKKSQGNYDLTTTKEGKYTYCFSNNVGGAEEKSVQFSVQGADRPPTDPKAIVDPVLDVVNELSRDIRGIKEEQQYILARERAHRATAESTNARVLWWSMFQTATLVGVCLFQIYYLKHFFETKRRI